ETDQEILAVREFPGPRVQPGGGLGFDGNTPPKPVDAAAEGGSECPSRFRAHVGVPAGHPVAACESHTDGPRQSVAPHLRTAGSGRRTKTLLCRGERFPAVWHCARQGSAT